MEASGKVLESQLGPPTGCRPAPAEAMGRVCLIEIRTNRLTSLRKALSDTYSSIMAVWISPCCPQLGLKGGGVCLPASRPAANTATSTVPTAREVETGESWVTHHPASHPFLCLAQHPSPPWPPSRAPGLRQPGKHFVLIPCFLLWARGGCWGCGSKPEVERIMARNGLALQIKRKR